MNPITILIDAATVLACALAVSGCGQESPAVQPAPEPTVAASSAQPNIVSADPQPTLAPTATPTPNPTLARYIFQDVTLCDALHNWDPDTTTIKTYPTSGNSESAYYLFTWQGVFFVATGGCEAGCQANATLTRSDIHGTVCTIDISNGQLQAVTP